ncbi:MAG: hypothetical protein IIX13_00050 [Bacteroidales bacterium]|nr:hypothetical protein [Bacteroidales bacterium]
MTEKQLIEGHRLLGTIHELQEGRKNIVEVLNDNRNDGTDAERIFSSMLYNLDYTRIKGEMKSLAERIVAELDIEIVSLKKKFEEL